MNAIMTGAVRLGIIVAVAGGAIWLSAGHPGKGGALIVLGVAMGIFELAASLFGRPGPNALDR
jgi:hypothetical protein